MATKRSNVKSTIAIVLIVMLMAMLLRSISCGTELWFDEICSIRYVQSVHSVWQALWSIHSDNKHHLIWVWMRLIGANRPDWAYRAPSLIAGLAVLPLLYRQVRRDFDDRSAILVMLLACFCYPLVFYSSEARGYSLAVFFAVAAFALAPDRRRDDSCARAMGFGIVVVLGFLSHLTFVYVYAGLLVWGAVDSIIKPRWILLLYQLPSLLILLCVYIFDVSKLEYGGGPPTTAVDVLRRIIAMIFGTPIDGVLPWIAGASLLCCCGLGWVVVARRFGLAYALFFIVSILIAPAAFTVTRHNPYLATRYYLLCIPFVLMLVAIGLASASRYLPGKILTGLLLAAVIVNGILSTRQLQLLGRGHVRDCLQQMSQLTPGDPITFGTERPAMDTFNIDYYSHATQPPGHFVLVQTRPPQWWILDLDSPFEVGPATIFRRGAAYKLDSVYPSDPMSGLTWDLYQRVEK